MKEHVICSNIKVMKIYITKIIQNYCYAIKKNKCSYSDIFGFFFFTPQGWYICNLWRVPESSGAKPQILLKKKKYEFTSLNKKILHFSSIKIALFAIC